MANAAAPATEQGAQAKFPPGIPYIIGNEGAERFSFYGMRQILYIYTVGLLLRFVAEDVLPAASVADAKVEATKITHAFFGGAYMFTLLGATVADRLLGKYRTIFWVSLIYCVGHAVLAVAGRLSVMGDYSNAETLFYIGLGLIAFAAGGIKPCVAANVGDQFTSENKQLLDVVFQLFYYVINFGSFLSTLLTPWLYRTYGPELAFGVPGILMAIATFIFWLGRKRFVHIEPATEPKLGLLDTLATLALFTPIFVLLYGVLNGWNPLWNIGLTVAGLALGGWLAHVRYRMHPHASFLTVMGYAATHRGEGDDGFFGPARKHFGDEAADGAVAVLRIALVFVMITMFWALYDQHASTWIEQARHMNLVVNVPEIFWSYFFVPAVLAAVLYSAVWLLRFVANKSLPRALNLAFVGGLIAWGIGAVVYQTISGTWNTITLNAAQSSALNPFFILITIPLFNIAIYRPLQRAGRPLALLTRMVIGMFLTALSFVAVALIQVYLETHGDGSLHVGWQAIPYFLLTAGEVLVSTTGLEFAYSQAPKSMKSTIMGLFYLTITLGDVFVIFMAPLMKLQFSLFFWAFAGVGAVAAVLFWIIASMYKGKTYAT